MSYDLMRCSCKAGASFLSFYYLFLADKFQITYIASTMLFLWDPDKAESNYKKHGVSFEMAQTVFDDPFHLSLLDHKKHAEERWITIGQAANAKTLIVVHSFKEDSGGEEIVRIISARKATKWEVENYEERI